MLVISMDLILNIDHPPGIFSSSEASTIRAGYLGVRANQWEWYSLIESGVGEVEGVDLVLFQLMPYLNKQHFDLLPCHPSLIKLNGNPINDYWILISETKHQQILLTVCL